VGELLAHLRREIRERNVSLFLPDSGLTRMTVYLLKVTDCCRWSALGLRLRKISLYGACPVFPRSRKKRKFIQLLAHILAEEEALCPF